VASAPARPKVRRQDGIVDAGGQDPTEIWKLGDREH